MEVTEWGMKLISKFWLLLKMVCHCIAQGSAYKRGRESRRALGLFGQKRLVNLIQVSENVFHLWILSSLVLQYMQCITF